MSDTQDKIRLLNSQISKLRTIENHYKSSQHELEDEKVKLEKLEETLNSEYSDIESLEKLTLKGVFHSILGDKEKQLEKARQEYLQVALKHNEAKTTIETLEYELRLLKRKSDLLFELETKLKGLQNMREKELKVENSPQGEHLRHILSEIDFLITSSNRVEEISNTGKIALKKLSLALLSLQEAKNWGNWDMMHKKGRHADYYKHGAIDEAKQFAFDAKRALIAFERELNEVGLRLNTKDLDISSLSSFLDVFFDNLITDWIFQQKIKKTLVNLNHVIDDVKKIMNVLEKNQQKMEKELSSLMENKEKLLLN